MRDIIVHDERLEGDSPTGAFTVVRVGQSTPLSRMVTRVRNSSVAHGTDVRLKIFAHGIYQDPARHETGGYGIQICAEGLNLNTVDQLRPLNGHISYGIDIYSCGAANTAPWQVGTNGDGWLLCSRIARITGATVRAALLPQWYVHFGGLAGLFRMPVNFGGWEGRVLTFDARGQQVDSQMSPGQ